jgi:ubiquinone/menaquinone biosynthesis C-methylase UbiE
MTATQKGYKGMGMEGRMAFWYADNTGRDQRRFASASQLIAERTPAGAEVLEVAPGPGYLAILMARSGRRVTALDISKTFIDIGRENARNAGVAIEFRHGNASAMPFDGVIFDYIICMAAFKNFADPIGAINEMHRVLKPGGQASILDLRKDVSMKEIRNEVENMRLSRWSAFVTRLTFRFLLLKRAYTPEDLERMMKASDFRRWEIKSEGVGFELHMFKE